MGRPTIGAKPMTAAERQRRHRKIVRQGLRAVTAERRLARLKLAKMEDDDVLALIGYLGRIAAQRGIFDEARELFYTGTTRVDDEALTTRQPNAPPSSGPLARESVT